MLKILSLLLGALLATAAGAATNIERVKSPGGIEAWLVREPKIPILALEASFREAGAARDADGKEGLANLVAGLLDEGAGPYESQAFAARLEDLAIRLSFDASRDAFSVSLRTLSENKTEAARLLGLALTQPRFDEVAVQRVRGQILSELNRRQEEPRRIAGEAWAAAAFPNHPYARSSEGTPASVAALTREDLTRFPAERLRRGNLIVAAVGDVTAAELGPLLDAAFGGLANGPAAAPVAETSISGRGMTVIRKSIPQSVVNFGLPGIKRDDPDWYAAYVMNYVLGGGGFKSRLIEEVREKRGLAYSIYSYLQPMAHAGIWAGGTATRNDRVAESIAVIKAELARLRDQGLTAEELAEAKTNLNGAFPLSLDSNSRIANLLVQMQRDKLGPEHLDKRAAYIDAVSLDDIRRVAKRLLDPDRLLITVVGDPQGLGG